MELKGRGTRASPLRNPQRRGWSGRGLQRDALPKDAPFQCPKQCWDLPGLAPEPCDVGILPLEAVHRGYDGSVETSHTINRTTQNGSDTTLKSVTLVVAVAAMFILGSCMAEPPAGVSRAPGGKAGGTSTATYPTNEAGQTYGAEDDNLSFDDRPDLILVEATNGNQGYVLRETLDEVTGANVSSPEKALEWQRRQDEAGWDRRVIPVFLSDGLTQIGVFEIGLSSPER